jgi:hypothetical protein
MASDRGLKFTLHAALLLLLLPAAEVRAVVGDGQAHPVSSH